MKYIPLITLKRGKVKLYIKETHKFYIKKTHKFLHYKHTRISLFVYIIDSFFYICDHFIYIYIKFFVVII